jgi:hypothetical protein
MVRFWLKNRIEAKFTNERRKAMTGRMQYPETDPRHHTLKIKSMLGDVVQHAREDIPKIKEPKAQALFETTAEVLIGLQKAFSDYEKGNEPAWRRS